MRSTTLLSRLFIALLALALVACSGSSSNSSAEETEEEDDSTIELPFGDPKPPEDVDDIETQEGFADRRFFIQDDFDSHDFPGLYAIAAEANSNAAEVDGDALTRLQAFTTLEMDSDSGRLDAEGVFYRAGTHFFHALAFDEDGTSGDRVRISSEDEAEKSCVGAWLLLPNTPGDSAFVYNRERKDDGTCPSSSSEWFQFQIRDKDVDEDHPQPFIENHTPVISLGVGEGAPGWLTFTGSGDDNSGEVYRVGLADVGTADGPIPVTLNGASAPTTSELSAFYLIQRLGADSLIVGFRLEGEAEAFRLGHYQRNDNPDDDTITELANLSSDEVSYPFPFAPAPSMAAVGGNAVFQAFGNAVLKVTANDFRLWDVTEEAGSPRFILTTENHVVWSLVTSDDDGFFHEVRYTKQSEQTNPTPIRAPYSETRVRGTRDGWAYFSVAAQPLPDGSLDRPFAIGLNPDLEQGFAIKDAQWIGASLQADGLDSGFGLDRAPVTEVFLRRGEELRNIAVINGADPEGGIATVGTLDSGFTATFMGPGFGPQRLLTAFSVNDGEIEAGDDPEGGELGSMDVQGRIYLADPANGTLTEASSQDGSLVRGISLF